MGKSTELVTVDTYVSRLVHMRKPPFPGALQSQSKFDRFQRTRDQKQKISPTIMKVNI
jgi:hypothetical protein